MREFKIVSEVVNGMVRVHLEGEIDSKYSGSYLVTIQNYSSRSDVPCHMVSSKVIGHLWHGDLIVAKDLESSFVAATGIGAFSRFYLKGEDLCESVQVETLGGKTTVEINHGSCDVDPFEYVWPGQKTRLVFENPHAYHGETLIKIPFAEMQAAWERYAAKNNSLASC
ncbi:MAG: hypothetical protein L6Q29_04800 [Candidatus Pacebacteria bacterium]|nr:hypothetical protein [Candidatus Paceibacterota bacterium]NUQ57479.1 hypothetical protein [Candidatus Paceibacter sp.]